MPAKFILVVAPSIESVLRPPMSSMEALETWLSCVGYRVHAPLTADVAYVFNYPDADCTNEPHRRDLPSYQTLQRRTGTMIAWHAYEF